jgi:hypothetical protein
MRYDTARETRDNQSSIHCDRLAISIISCPPINLQSLLKILPSSKSLVRFTRLSEPFQDIHDTVLIWTIKERNRVPLLARNIPHPMHRALPQAAGEEFEKVAHVDDKGALVGLRGHPDAVAVEDLERGPRHLLLAEQREEDKVRVRANAHVVVALLRRVVQGPDVGQGESCDGVKVVFGEA